MAVTQAPGRRPTRGAAVEIRGLRVAYGHVVAVDGLDLTAEGGEVVALLGPNGAGKTSTVEAAEGYRRPAGGTVRVLGYDPVADHRSLSPLIGVMLQRGGVYPGMGTREALHLFARYYARPEGADALLDAVGLGRVARTPWRRLSGGEQQRLSLALALIGRPRAVFLDEPTSGVDPEGRQVVRRVVDGLRQRGACVLLTTHELEEAERLADRVCVIDRGRLVAAGTLDELAAQAGPEEVQWSTVTGGPTAVLGERLGAVVEELGPGRYRAVVPGSPANVAAIAGWLAEQGLPMNGLRSGRAPLEELYLRLTARQAGAGEGDGGGTDPEAPGTAAPGPRSPRRRR